VPPRKRARKKPSSEDPLEAYRRVRKPMPPPARVVPDRRRKVQEEIRRREAREAEDEGRGER
jgi:hypothetical protein